MGAKVELKGKLCDKKMRLTELANLKKGDIIPIEMPDTVLMLANGIPAFRGKLGEANGNLALQVTSKVERPESDSSKESRLTWMREQAFGEGENS
jgi:flagellar motor switch protein FliM